MYMLKMISEKAYQWSNWKTIMLSTILFFGFLLFVLPEMSERSKLVTGTGLSPDTLFFYTPQKLYEIAEVYGEEGRSYYIKTRFSFDIVWPIAYFFFLITTSSAVLRSFKWKHLNLAPFFGMLFDYFENISASIVMLRYPQPTVFVANIAPFFTSLKWLFIYFSFAVLAIGSVVILWRKLSNRV